MYSKYIKPFFDITIAIIALILLSPIFFFTALILIISNGSNPFFLQSRPGLNEKIFLVIKFKTMNNKKDENGNLLPDIDRTTFIGKYIRKYSLDEIPQLINVILGNMSWVGPRPLLPEYLPHYSTEQKLRHTVKPGITGWAQINGRNSISWSQKFEYDVWYVKNISFLLDIKILLKTVIKVIVPKGINSNDTGSSSEFNGNN
jgi:undecaprenyl phosphate N,N'-diacetylbacillosamine 1-phosphate transferase